MTGSEKNHQSFVDLLRHKAEVQPEHRVFTFLEDGEARETHLTYGQLHQRASAIAAHLETKGLAGERALLLYAPGFEYICSFFGCLYAGVTAVPAYPPDPLRLQRSLPRLQAIIKDAGCATILTTEDILGTAKTLMSSAPAMAQISWCTTDGDLGSDPASATQRSFGLNDLAFLQYTSGSTGTPKGVMLTHGNLLHNQMLISRAFELTDNHTCVIWLPPYHDMGLIGGIMATLYVGFHTVLMSPIAFLERPIRWLEAISKYKGTLSGGPNFAYDLCARRLTQADRERLDLSSWKLAFSGAEPVRADTMDRFSEATGDCGFNPASFYPCYGLAEGTLLVTGSQPGKIPARIKPTEIGPGEPKNKIHVSSGRPPRGARLLIVDPETLQPCSQGTTGEIWVAGGSNASGYWNRPEASKETFDARTADGEGPFLRTGDLGFLKDDDLFVTGRLKDLIIVRGQNHYPQDLEQTVEQCHPALKPGGCVAFAAPSEGNDQLVIVAEIDTSRQPDLLAVIRGLRQAISERHELAADAIVLIKPRSLPKTSSGKVQRRQTRKEFLAERLRIVKQWRVGDGETKPAQVSSQDAGEVLSTGPQKPLTEASVRQWIRQLFSTRMNIPLEEFEANHPITQYGLDSLTAVELAHDLETGLGTPPGMTRLLEGSIDDLATWAWQESQNQSLEESDALEEEQSADLFPLSGEQRGLWFLSQLAPESAAYHIYRALDIKGAVDLTALAQAFQDLVARHPALRTTFVLQDGEPVQRLHTQIKSDIDWKDSSGWTESVLQEHMVQDATAPFDLEGGPLLRVRLYIRNQEDMVLVLVIHHLIVDFWSLSILIEELGELYHAASKGKEAALPHLSSLYSDYVYRQRRRLVSQAGQNLRGYWMNQLGGEIPNLHLPVDHARPEIQTYRGASQSFELSPRLVGQLKQLARGNQSTMYMVLMAAYKVLLHRTTGQNEILVGTPNAGRDQAEFAKTVGYFVNLLIIRSQLSGQQDFSSFLAQTRNTALDAFRHGAYPFANLVEDLKPRRDPGRSALFQAMFVWQQPAGGSGEDFARLALGLPGAVLKLGDLNLTSHSIDTRPAQVDISLLMAEGKAGISGVFEYNRDLFESETMARLADRFETLLGSLTENPHQTLADLDVLSRAERETLLVAWSGSAQTAEEPPLLPQAFQDRAAQVPHGIALVANGSRITYAALAQQVRGLSSQLRQKGVGPENHVAVFMERSPAMLIAILAVLETGAAYVPIDPGYPSERVNWMLQDSGAVLILTDPQTREKAQTASSPVLVIDGPMGDAAQNHTQLPTIDPAQVAYLIYTSGSTGRPKGVMISHGNAASMVDWARSALPENAVDGVLLATSVCFDLSVYELFVPLTSGGRLILADDLLASADMAQASETRLINTVPSAMTELLRIQPSAAKGRFINLAGEPLPHSLVQALYRGGAKRVTNLYAPSETTTYSTVAVLDQGDPLAPSIGVPITGTRSFALDAYGRLTPTGSVGELHLGGKGLTRGYFQRPALTAERYIPDSLSGESGARLYRTGDLVRYRADGQMEFQGRADYQVKLRGFRIELGEIEAVLFNLPKIESCAVTVLQSDASNNSDQTLVAFVVCQDPRPTSQDIKRDLAIHLPDYMVPTSIVFLPEMPLTPNGKIDRSRLPKPDQARTEERPKYLPPRTETELALCRIWEEVLDVRPIGAKDSFFELGGHSLLATRMLAQAREHFQIAIPVQEVFQSPILTDLANKIDSLRGETSRLEPPTAYSGSDQQAPLSFVQERLWFLERFQPGNSYYHFPAAVRLSGSLDVSVLERCMAEIQNRHQVLGSVFPEENGVPVQVANTQTPFSLSLWDLAQFGPDRQKALVADLIPMEVANPFNLTNGPVWRVRLIRLSQDEHILMVTMHHVVSDGWSIGVLIQELTALYQAFQANQPSPLSPPRLQFSDVARWNRTQFQGAVMEDLLDHWRGTLSNLPTMLELPTDHPRPATLGLRGETVRFTLDAHLTQGLEDLSRNEGTTLFMTLLSGLGLLLSRYSGQDDLCIGSPIANRQFAQLEPMIGCFLNTLVLRISLNDDPTCQEVLSQVRQTTLDAFAHQDMPFEKLVEELQPVRDPSRSPLFQVMFVLQNMAIPETQFPGLASSVLEIENSDTAFDLSLSMIPKDGGLQGSLIFNRDLFEAPTATRMANHFRQLLCGFIEHPTLPAGEVQLLTETERMALVVELNDTQFQLPQVRLLHGLFENLAEQEPDAIALTVGDQQWRYGELNQKADSLAVELNHLGMGPEDCVGLLCHRNENLLIGVLGILKAGAAYLPLDPTYPEQRLDFMVADAASRVLVLESGLENKLTSDADKVYLDKTRKVPKQQTGVAKPTAENLAYLIYTSGSTGKPKAVAISHGNSSAMVQWAGKAYSRDWLDGVLAGTSVCFDLSVFEMFVPLSWGGTVILVEDALGLAQLKHPEQVTLINTVPSAARELLRLDCIPNSLKAINLAGEPLPRSLAQALAQLPCKPQVINLYAPSETTTYSTIIQLDPSETGPVLIGRPIANTTVYVLNPQLQPAPVGVTGELWIGGAGVTRGYLNRPAMTAQKFLPDPFGQQPGARLYRTGDLVKYADNGQLAFVGRVDDQVKLRGFRIELGEIEAALTSMDEVASSVVITFSDTADSQPKLVAYFSFTEGATVGIDELKRRLSKKMPLHMVPALFVQLDAIPLTPNGKIDRKALPKPSGMARTITTESVPPSNEFQRGVLEIFQNLLQVPSMGITDHFFENGGHSLLAVQAVARIRSLFGVELSLPDFFEHPSAETLARQVQEAGKATGEPLLPMPEEIRQQNDIPLSSAQLRLWFLERFQPGNRFYHFPVAVILEGNLNREALERSLSEIVDRHEILSTAFPSANGLPQVNVRVEQPFSLKFREPLSLDEANLGKEALDWAMEATSSAFDLETGPLFRAECAPISEQKHLLVIDMHHIVSDGWSIGVLVRELQVLYRAFSSGGASPLEPLSIQYSDYSHWQKGWFESDAYKADLDYWCNRLQDAPDVLDLPTDHPRPSSASYQGAAFDFALPPQLGDKVRDFGASEGYTTYMTLLAGFQTLLYRYSGQADFCTGSPVANRTFPELEGLMGCFVNTLVLRAEMEGNPSFNQLMTRVKTTTLDAFAHQVLPFEKIVEVLHPQRDPDNTPFFQVMFILQNAPLGNLDLPELTVRPLDVTGDDTTFDLIVSFREENGTFMGNILYATDLFEAATIAAMAENYTTLLGNLLDDPTRRIANAPMLPEVEKQKLLFGWNQTAVDYPTQHCVHHFLEQQVARTPDTTAVVHNQEHITYLELNRRANRLARYLVDNGAYGRTVALVLPPGLDLIVSLFAVLKAGGAYIPMDVETAPDRMAYMVSDAESVMVLTTEALSKDLSLGDLPQLKMDGDMSAVNAQSGENLKLPGSGENLAYIVYTSGSTGLPKGVQVPHKALLNHNFAVAQGCNFHPPQRMLQFTPINFDAAGEEIYPPLLHGLTIVICGELIPSSQFMDLIGRENLSLLSLPPAYLHECLHDMERLGKTIPNSLQLVLLGGEKIPPDTRAVWCRLGGTGIPWFNVYGPTEATITSTMYQIQEGASESPSEQAEFPIGNPINNARAYVADFNLEPRPTGLPGELLIGGAGLSWGYVKGPAMTAEKFIPDPFSGESGQRLYKTGDAARYLEDGKLDFMGRVDLQVNIRGFRIEPGEIENVLRQHDHVREAVVVPVQADTGGLRLAAYIVPDGESEQQASDLKTFSKQKLPHYMVPEAWVFLASLPLTSGGKINRKALPKPSFQTISSENYVAPETPSEIEMADLWAAVAGVERVGMEDNFFDLGGNSLLALQLVERITETFNVNLSLRELFEAPTAKGVLTLVLHSKASAADPELLAQLLNEMDTDEMSDDEPSVHQEIQ